MKKLILLIAISTYMVAKINTVVSILPQKTFVEKIGGDKVNVSLMIQPGNSPHTYEPKPSQMKDIAKADIYFSIGVEFDTVWLEKFLALNKTMAVVKLDSGIEKIEIEEHSHGEEEGHEGDDHSNHTLDPHVWTTPKNVKVIAKNIYNTLVETDIANKEYYKKNYDKFLAEIEETDKKINDILLALDDKAKFVVFHPSWGYFAKDYKLTQVAIESGGKNPKAKHLQKIISTIKNDYIEVVITAPEFNDTTAKMIADATGIKVIKVSPLNPKWSKNLINLSNAIAGK